MKNRGDSMIDTHCHISKDYYNDIPFLIDKIKTSGIDKAVSYTHLTLPTMAVV